MDESGCSTLPASFWCVACIINDDEDMRSVVSCKVGDGQVLFRFVYSTSAAYRMKSVFDISIECEHPTEMISSSHALDGTVSKCR